MTAVYEIPLVPQSQTFSVELSGVTYNMRLVWNDSDAAPGWLLDIADSQDNPILCGVPLQAGEDLLGQFAYLGMGGKLFCGTDGDPLTPPTYENLGLTAHLWWIPDGD